MNPTRLILFAFLSFLLTGCGSSGGGSSSTLLDKILKRDQLDTFSSAVLAAGLADELDEEGPWTVFAPNNQAFDVFTQEQLDALLANPAALEDAISYHIVAANLKTSDLENLDRVQTIQGSFIEINGAGDSLRVNDAIIKTRNIGANNGTLHIIDRVLTP